MVVVVFLGFVVVVKIVVVVLIEILGVIVVGGVVRVVVLRGLGTVGGLLRLRPLAAFSRFFASRNREIRPENRKIPATAPKES